MSNPNNNTTQAPDFAKTYKEGLQTYLKFLPTELQQELGYRAQYNPAFTQQALDLQHQFDPALAGEQLSALQRRDPQWLALHQGLGDRISQALSRGYVDPLQAQAYANLGMMAGQVDPRYQAMYSGMAGKSGQVDPRYAAAYNKLSGLAGTVDPRQEAAYNQWAQLAGKQAKMAGQTDAQRNAAYKALGQQVTGDTLRGTTADPATLRQMTQAILSRSPNLSSGEAQDMAAAVYVGQRGQQLQQQRQGATGSYLQQMTPEQQAQQSMLQGSQALGQFYQSPSITQQKQQSLGQFSQVLDPTRMSQQSYLQGLSALDPTRMSQQSLGQFYGMNAPEMQAYGLAGTFIQPSNSVTNAINSIQGVTAPSAMQYVNPNAGYQGVQFGLQNFQNSLAANNQGSSNPWTGALQGAATGAQYGSIGGGYGAIGGALTGATAGAFGYPQYSSERLKKDIVKVGEKNGLDIVEFRYRTPRSALFRGVIAEQVKELYPNAVVILNGFLAVKYEEIGIPFEKYCTKCQQFKNVNEFYVEKRKVKRLCTHSAHCIPCAKKASFEWSLRNRESKRRVNQRRRKAERKYEREKWRNDIVFKLKCRLRWFLRHHVKAGKKSARARELLGCSVEEFKEHLQKQFRDGMAWNNYGKWHIDHIRPCSSFDLLDPKQQQLCFHYTNTQPLWAEENRLKGGTWVTEREVQ